MTIEVHSSPTRLESCSLIGRLAFSYQRGSLVHICSFLKSVVRYNDKIRYLIFLVLSLPFLENVYCSARWGDKHSPKHLAGTNNTRYRRGDCNSKFFDFLTKFKPLILWYTENRLKHINKTQLVVRCVQKRPFEAVGNLTFRESTKWISIINSFATQGFDKMCNVRQTLLTIPVSIKIFIIHRFFSTKNKDYAIDSRTQSKSCSQMKQYLVYRLL